MKKYTLSIWLMGQGVDEPAWFIHDTVADSTREALQGASDAMKLPNGVLTLYIDSDRVRTVVSGSKILFATAEEQTKEV